MLTQQIQPQRLPVADQLDHIRRVQQTEDPDSWQVLLGVFAAAIYRYAHYGITDQHEAAARESIILERFVRAIRRFNPDVGVKPSTYVFNCIRKSINCTEHRGAIRGKHNSWNSNPESYARLLEHTFAVDSTNEDRLPPTENNIPETAIRHEQARFLRSAICKLNPKQRHVIRHRLRGHTLASIAGQLDLSNERIRQLESAGKARLKSLLAGKLD